MPPVTRSDASAIRGLRHAHENPYYRDDVGTAFPNSKFVGVQHLPVIKLRLVVSSISTRLCGRAFCLLAIRIHTRSSARMCCVPWLSRNRQSYRRPAHWRNECQLPCSRPCRVQGGKTSKQSNATHRARTFRHQHCRGIQILRCARPSSSTFPTATFTRLGDCWQDVGRPRGRKKYTRMLRMSWNECQKD